MHPLSDFVSLGEELAGCLEVRRDLLVKRPAVNLEIAPFRLKSRRPDKRWPWDIWISIRWDRHALRLVGPVRWPTRTQLPVITQRCVLLLDVEIVVRRRKPH